MVQISRILAFLSVASVGLAVVVQRQASVENDFSVILADVQAFVGATNKFNGAQADALVVAGAAGKLNSAVQAATNDVTAFPGTFPDSVTVELLTSFQALPTQPLAAAFIAKLPEFAALGLKPECCTLVTTNAKLVAALGLAVEIKAGDLKANVTSEFSAVTAVLGKIVAASC